MRAACPAAGIALAVLIGSACSPAPAPPPAAEVPPPPPVLRSPETFDWSGGKISFSLPPSGWRREGETSGGIKGVRFVKERSVGEAIGVGDYYILADRNRRAPIREILQRFDAFNDSFAWDRALRGAWAYTDTPFTALESEIAERVNSEVSQAGAAYRKGDRDAAKGHLEAALAAADRLRFSLDDVIARVEFRPERQQNPEWYRILGRRDTIIADEPAVIVDYTVKVPERLDAFAAREVYFVHNSHLFICTFIGRQETLAVFDAVVESIAFPR